MDETEVQVEIACWTQAHPEAAHIIWPGGNEPWVSFPREMCTLHMGLGSLIWSIGVPIGYQTQLNSVDGSRERCWDPLDLHDTVIVPDRNTPFRVSVFNPKNDNNVLEETSLLVQQPGCDFHNAEEHVTNLFEQLRISDENTDNTSNNVLRLTATNRNYFEAMNKAETLSEVLDAILALTTFYAQFIARSKCTDSYSMDTNDSTGESYGDDLFEPESAYKWSSIKAQVEYAADACRMARKHVECGGTNTKVTKEKVTTLVEKRDNQEIADITGRPGSALPPDFDNESMAVTDEYTFLRRRNNIIASFSHIRSDSELSDGTDDSWEDVGEILQDCMSDSGNDDDISSSRVIHSLGFNQRGGASIGVDGRADLPAPTSTTGTGYEEAVDAGFGGQTCELQYCDISFNSESFSVECTIMLAEFMQNKTSALAAMGLSIEYPLRIEVVPNKEQVDALAWTGLVEVFVSQQSESHSHVSEEVCGLLCFVPHVVRHYFEQKFFAELHHQPAREPNGELFIGLLKTVVDRLLNVSRDCCCICSESLEEFSRTFTSRIMWPCNDNFCQALYASWQVLSSFDADERVRQEQESLADVEKDLREDFPYSDCILDNLKCALHMYNVDSEGLHYGQMIRALARIELWNRRDLDQVS